jgi:hypothetical protein
LLLAIGLQVGVELAAHPLGELAPVSRCWPPPSP